MPEPNKERKFTDEELERLLRIVNPFPVVRGEYFKAGEEAALVLGRNISFNALTETFMRAEEYGRLLLIAAQDEPKLSEVDQSDPAVFDHQIDGYTNGFATGLVDAMVERETGEDKAVRKELEARKIDVGWVTHQPSFIHQNPVIMLWVWPNDPEARKLLNLYYADGYVIVCHAATFWGQILHLTDNPV